LAVAPEEVFAKMFARGRLSPEAVTAIAAHAPELEVVEVEGGGNVSPRLAKRAVAVFGEGVVSVVQGTDSHGAPTETIEVPEGAKPQRRVAFVRKIEGDEPIGVFVVSKSLHAQLFDGYAAKFGHAPTLLPPGAFVRVVNSEIYQSANPLFVITFTPLVVAFFTRRERRGATVSTAQKLFIGMVITTVSLLFMALAGFVSDGGAERVSFLWLIGFYALVTVGELCLSPMGLSLVTRLSPERLVGLTMGGWFLATAFGNNFSGFFGGIQGLMSPVAFFTLLAGLSGLVAAYLRIILPRLDAAIAGRAN